MSAGGRSDRTLRVSGTLMVLQGAGHPAGEPIHVTVAVNARSAGRPVEVSIFTETGVEWVLSLDPALGAYLSGTLAAEAGVSFG